MKTSKRIGIIIGSFLVGMSIWIFGCGGMAKVPLTNYEPVFTEGHSSFKGKSIYLMNFENQVSEKGMRIGPLHFF